MSISQRQNNAVSFQNNYQMHGSNNSQVNMEMEEDEEMEELYESAHVNDLLQTSYVELEYIADQVFNGEDTINFNSGESFFQKTNHMVLSEMGNKKYRRMQNKKLQCNIGSGMSHGENSTSLALESKLRRLEILKVIKLVKLIFKLARNCQEKVKQELNSQGKKNKKLFESFTASVRSMQQKYNDALGRKDMRILQLQEEISRMSNMNEWLAHKLESNEIASQQLIHEIQEDKIKSMAEINDVSLSASLKVEEFQEQNESLENQISFFQQEVSNLQDISNSHEIHIKKLEYQNGELEKQNHLFLLKQERIMRQYQEHEQNYNQLSLQLSQTNEEMVKLTKINDLYQKELESTKQEVKRLTEINEQIIKQSENIIFSELERYQEEFNAEIARLKQHHSQDIFDKNAELEDLRQIEQNYFKLISKDKHKVIKSVIFKNIDTNSSQSSINYQSQEIIRPVESSSQCFITHNRASENECYTQLNIQRKDERKTSFKKIISHDKVANSKKVKIKSLTQDQPKKSLIPPVKKSTSKQFVFKAKDAASNRKLSEYLQMKEEKMLSASDGNLQTNHQINKMQAKLSKLNQNLDQHLLQNYRK